MEIIRGLVTPAALVIILNTSACPSLTSLSCSSPVMTMKRTSGGQHAPACCSMWLRQVDGGETEQRMRSKTSLRVMDAKWMKNVPLTVMTLHWTKRTLQVLIPIFFLSTEFDHAGRRSVGAGMIDMALHACQQFLRVLEHCDIDVTVETPPAVQEQQWAKFLQDYYMVVQWVCFLAASSVC